MAKPRVSPSLLASVAKRAVHCGPYRHHKRTIARAGATWRFRAGGLDNAAGMGVTRHAGRKLAAIYLGGVIGALLRVGLSEAFPPDPGTWPWPTFTVNMVGALLLGYLFAALRDQPAERLAHPLLATGICGTLTTFSTLQLELFDLVDGGHLLALASAYCAVTVGAGYFCLRLGINIEEERPRWLR